MAKDSDEDGDDFLPPPAGFDAPAAASLTA